MNDTQAFIIEQLALGRCDCGQPHAAILPDLISGTSLWPKLAAWLRARNLSRVYLIADQNTYQAAGESLRESLLLQGFKVTAFVYPCGRPEPDAPTIARALENKPADADALIAAGSGTLNDIGKVVAHRAGLPYAIAATAASMDGYTSATASLLVDGQKVSLPAKAADLVVADMDVIAAAPLESVQSGVGDIAAKVTSLAEWKMASIITGEPYCQTIADLVQSGVDTVLDAAPALATRETGAVRALFDGLYASGLAMNLAGHSRPASGTEHYISHLWDMRAAALGKTADSHGRQCGVGTLIALDLMAETMQLDPEQFIPQTTDLLAHNAMLQELLGDAAETLIRQEAKEGKYNPAAMRAHLKRIGEHWAQIKDSLASAVARQAETADALRAVGAPLTVSELTVSAPETARVIVATKDIRDKYIVTRLLHEAGVLHGIASRVAARHP